MKARWQSICCIWRLGLVASGLPLRIEAGESLDDFLSCLETNGIVIDRSAVLSGGLKGMLQSIDPAAILDEVNSAVREVNKEDRGPAIQAVELWPENLAYLKVSGLEPGSGVEIFAHIQSLGASRGLLFDLRGARGEDLESVGILAGLVYGPQEPLFIITDNKGTALLTNIVTGIYAKRPVMMMLIDKGTGGASEALASLFKGCPGVMLIGSVSRGDPYLHQWLSLPGGRTARLTMRKWKPVSGGTYEKVGIRPDILVGAMKGAGNDGLGRTNKTDRVLSLKSDVDRDLMLRVAGDVVLQRATDILLGIQALGEYGRE